MEIRLTLLPSGQLDIQCSEDKPFTALALLAAAQDAIRQQHAAREQQVSVQPVSNGQLATLLKGHRG